MNNKHNDALLARLHAANCQLIGALEHHAAISDAIAALAEQPACTCPSGDGSLRHPCPSHPAEQPAGAVASAYEGVCPDCNNLDCDCDTIPPAAPTTAAGDLS